MSWRFLILGTIWGIFFSSCSRDISSEPLSLAQGAVGAPLRDRLLMIKASGPANQPEIWSFYFYDPTFASRTRYVKIADHQIKEMGGANHRRPSPEAYTFSSDQIQSTYDQALRAVRRQAKDQNLVFDSVQALLFRAHPGQAPSWQINLRQQGEARGTFFCDPHAQQVAYQAPSPNREQTLGLASELKNSFRQVENEWEEFFSGD